jgi:hypothetical protein
VLWLERGGPRSFVVACGVALAAAALLLTLPLDRMVTVLAAQDAFTLIPLLKLREASSLDALQIVFSIGVAIAVLAFVLLPRRLLVLLPALLLAAFIAASVSASLYVRDQAAEQREHLLGSNPRWVDRAAAGPVAYVYAGEPDWDAVWHTLFWNHKFHWVYDLPNSELPGPVPQRTMWIAPDGRLVETGRGTTSARYGVISNSHTLVGTPIAQIAQTGIRQSGLRLWRIDPPMRLSTSIFGLRPNGDIEPGVDGRLLAYGCKPGDHFLVTLIVKTRTTIELLRNGIPYRRLVYPALRPNTLWHGRVPAIEGTGANAGTCTLDIRSSGLIGTTVFDVERAS